MNKFKNYISISFASSNEYGLKEIEIKRPTTLIEWFLVKNNSVTEVYIWLCDGWHNKATGRLVSIQKSTELTFIENYLLWSK